MHTKNVTLDRSSPDGSFQSTSLISENQAKSERFNASLSSRSLQASVSTLFHRPTKARQGRGFFFTAWYNTAWHVHVRVWQTWPPTISTECQLYSTRGRASLALLLELADCFKSDDYELNLRRGTLASRIAASTYHHTGERLPCAIRFLICHNQEQHCVIL